MRRFVEAWNRRDLTSLLGMAAPDIEYLNSPSAVEPGTRRGRDEYERVLRAQWEVVGDARLEIESVQAVGDDAFVMLHMSRTLPGSDARVEVRIGMRIAFRDGRVLRQEIIPADAFPQALEAAAAQQKR